MTLQDPSRSPIPYRRGNVAPLLNEIGHALDARVGMALEGERNAVDALQELENPA